MSANAGLVLSGETMGENEKGERWSGAMTNLTEMASNLDSLQKLLLTKAVFVDDDTFSKASLAADQARSIKLLHQRVQTLEREVDAAITAAARARSEKRQAEAAQKSAESRAQQLTAELENTTSIIILSFSSLRSFHFRFQFSLLQLRFVIVLICNRKH